MLRASGSLENLRGQAVIQDYLIFTTHHAKNGGGESIFWPWFCQQFLHFLTFAAVRYPSCPEDTLQDNNINITIYFWLVKYQHLCSDIWFSCAIVRDSANNCFISRCPLTTDHGTGPPDPPGQPLSGLHHPASVLTLSPGNIYIYF